MKNKELERHEKVLNRINSASKKEELPSIGYSSILQIISDIMCFNNNKLDRDTFKVVIDKLNSGYSFRSNEIRRNIMIILLNNYSDLNEKEVTDKYIELINNEKINNILSEIQLRNEKIRLLDNNTKKTNHEYNVKRIKETYSIKNFPKAGLSELNKELLSCVNNNDFVKNIKTSEISELTEAYLNKESFDYIKVVVGNMVHKFNIPATSKSKMKEQIIAALILNINIDYIIEEMDLKEERKTFIYKFDHEEVMDTIKNATRISQLPPDLSISTLTSYLNGNSTIYTNDNRFNSEDFKQLTYLLLNGEKFENDSIKKELRKICENKYKDKEDAFDLLFDKLSKLPKTYYLVDEINYYMVREQEFIRNHSSNVNVYFIENKKNTEAGGNFLNCYINREDNLNLGQLLPLDLSKIIPPKMDIDSIEWYVQEKYDPTFKLAGGIILKKDEKIGNVNVFRPNDGKIGVSKEEKEKMDSISDLDKEIKEKEELLKLLNDKINNSKNEYNELNNKIDSIISEYEEKAIKLQQEMMDSIKDLKTSYQKTKKL